MSLPGRPYLNITHEMVICYDIDPELLSSTASLVFVFSGYSHRTMLTLVSNFSSVHRISLYGMIQYCYITVDGPKPHMTKRCGKHRNSYVRNDKKNKTGLKVKTQQPMKINVNSKNLAVWQ